MKTLYTSLLVLPLEVDARDVASRAAVEVRSAIGYRIAKNVLQRLGMRTQPQDFIPSDLTIAKYLPVAPLIHTLFQSQY